MRDEHNARWSTYSRHLCLGDRTLKVDVTNLRETRWNLGLSFDTEASADRATLHLDPAVLSVALVPMTLESHHASPFFIGSRNPTKRGGTDGICQNLVVRETDQ